MSSFDRAVTISTNLESHSHLSVTYMGPAGVCKHTTLAARLGDISGLNVLWQTLDMLNCSLYLVDLLHFIVQNTR